MSKLSEVQRKVLEALAADPENHWIRTDRHSTLTPFLVGVGGQRCTAFKVYTKTLVALRKRGYIKRFERKKAPWWAKDYRITEAGMEAVIDGGQ